MQFKKTILLMILLLTITLVKPVNASVFVTENGSPDNWNSTFRLYKKGYDDGNYYELIYGFNKRIIGSDDYVEGYHASKWHVVHVGQSGAYDYTTQGPAGTWIYRWKYHNTDYVRYGLSW